MSKSPKSNKHQARAKGKGLHPRSSHNQDYDFKALIEAYPALEEFVKPNAYGNLSVEFGKPEAIRALNRALLKSFYKVGGWKLPEGALCPPIPGRADYIHYIAEMLGIPKPTSKTKKALPKLKMLDIGTGSSGIYCLLAAQIYGWHCVGSDINPVAITNVEKIASKNPDLKPLLNFRKQSNKDRIFGGVVLKGEQFDISICNPPFHPSKEAAEKGSLRKETNLARNRGEKISRYKPKGGPTLNFGGLDQELWYSGGEYVFLRKMIKESKEYANQITWFTSLVSKNENVEPLLDMAEGIGATDCREIEMATGNKVTRVIAWTFS